MKKMIGLVLSVVLVSGMMSGCSEVEKSSTTKEKEYQEELMQQSTNEIGMPEITEFYEKKLAKEIFEKRDDSKLVCYAYSQNLEGKFVFVGKCLGYGLPYSTQYTNPMKLASSYSDATALPQSDPNGLYGASGLSATWLMMIDEETGGNYIMYCEPTIVVTEHKIPKRLVEDWSLPEKY